MRIFSGPLSYVIVGLMFLILAHSLCLANGWFTGITDHLPRMEPRHIGLVLLVLALILMVIDLYYRSKLKKQVRSADGNICPFCRYCTHVAPGARCPECGTVFTEELVQHWHKWMNSFR